VAVDEVLVPGELRRVPCSPQASRTMCAKVRMACVIHNTAVRERRTNKILKARRIK
jgi:hypothetical protein